MPSFRPSHESDTPLIAVEDAQARILGAVRLVATERVRLRDARGRVLRSDVIAAADVPPADNSGMDGYAVRAADTSRATEDAPCELAVTGDVPAGGAGTLRGDRTALRIMTGAPIPEGADAVVQVEWTDAGMDRVRIYREVRAGANVRRRGEDMRRGDVVVTAGTRMEGGEIGAIAAAQCREIEVARRPVVAIVPTGDELVELDDVPAPGKIVNSNALALAALVESVGAAARVRSIVRDDRAATVEAIRSVLDADFVVTTGGVSVGAYDFVKEAVAELGGTPLFWRIAMKPGKPVFAATVGDTFVFGLPGNPVSTTVAFHLFVAPALRRAMGKVVVLPPIVRVRIGSAIRSKGDRRTYIRARMLVRDGELVAEARPAQGSGVTTSMVGAQLLVVVPEGVTELAAESIAEAVMIAGAS